MHPAIGIIMVTARNGLTDKISGYDNGADIYLTKPTSLEELAAAVSALSRRIITWAGDSPQLPLDPGQLKATERARAIYELLVNTRGKLPTMEELAAQYGCSVRTLNAEFCAEYGQTVVNFITEYRFKLAHDTISQTTIPLKLLAQQLGYSHVNHFIHAFRRKFGCAPGSLRR